MLIENIVRIQRVARVVIIKIVKGALVVLVINNADIPGSLYHVIINGLILTRGDKFIVFRNEVERSGNSDLIPERRSSPKGNGIPVVAVCLCWHDTIRIHISIGKVIA